MNRTHYFNYIEDKLGTLAYRINIKGKLNILDLHNHSENFYLYFLNKLFGYNFENVNAIKQNVEAIDLIDHGNKCICQISATNTKQKVESALAKELLKNYPTYEFKFISISKDSTDLRKETFKNPYGVQFDVQNDIIDNKSILNTILGKTAGEQKKLYQFIRDELGNDVDIVKLDTNLALIINILSKDDFSLPSKLIVNSFEIERKIEFNNLQITKELIEQYATYFQRVDNKYVQFDTQGSNKSLSVLQSINKSYIEESLKNTSANADSIFIKTVDNVIHKVLNSANYIQIPLDELELCVNVLIVDAFIRCKIFKNPSEYNYATA
jgi:hypothetical protein